MTFQLIPLITGVIVIVLPFFLIAKIVQDLVFKKKQFFKYFEQLPRLSEVLFTTSAFIFVICLWFFLSYSGAVSNTYLPTPVSTWHELERLITTGEIFPNLCISLRRIFIGFGLASIVGVLFGSLAGIFTNIRSLVLPINSSLRYIPPTAFISLTIIWFGIEETGKIALIFIAIVFYITQMVADVVKLTPKTFIEASQMLGLNRYKIFTRVVLSYSMPEIISVLRVNLGAAWTFLIVAELVAAQKGLGYLMAVSQRFLDTPKLFALLIIVALLGFITDTLFALLIKRLGRWK